jgi:heme exporter protein D
VGLNFWIMRRETSFVFGNWGFFHWLSCVCTLLPVVCMYR